MVDIKKNIKKVIRKISLKSYEVQIENDTIIVTLETSVFDAVNVKINSKKYKVKNNTVRIPLTGDNLDAVINKKISIEFNTPKQTATVEIPQKFRKISGENIHLSGRKYYYSENDLLQLDHFEVTGDDFSFSYNLIGFGNQPVLFYLTDQKFNIADTCEPDGSGKVVFRGFSEKALENKMQIFAVSDKKAYQLVMPHKKAEADIYTIEQQKNRVYVYDSQSVPYTFESSGILSSLAPAVQKSKRIRFDYDSELEAVLFKADKKYDFVFSWQDLSTDERTEIFTAGSTDKAEIPLKPYLNQKIGYFNRKILHYTVSDESRKIEEGYVRITGTKKRLYQNNILAESDQNRIIVLMDDILLLENKECFLTYPKKYEYDFSKGAFLTDISGLRYEKDVLEFDLTLDSLLLPISSAVIFVTDNYKKRSYFLKEIVFENTSAHISEHVQISLDKIRRQFYNNMRLSFRIGIRYSTGYAEQGFICAKAADYRTRERYIFEEHEDDMVCAFYLGENHYNLNLWYSSQEEYDKGVTYQIGRETYFETVEKEAIENDLILFEANLGKNYTGNPKYLYEYMISHPQYRNFRYVWVYSDPDTDKIPGSPVIVERGSKEYFYYLAKAKYRINNIRFPIPHKKAGQVYLNTWHGTPLKKLGFDIEVEGPEKQAFGSLYNESLNWDYMTVDNDYGEEKLVSAFHFEGTVIKKGYPINDIYYDEERKARVKKRLYEAYPILQKKKVILYAPTWRDLKGDYVRGYEFSLPFDLGKLYDGLHEDYVILVKLHHLIADNLQIPEKYKDFILNTSNEEDIMELLCVTDILITDYSSVFYDFASARKPMLFYMYDLEEYLNETRGTYVSVDTLPGPIIKDDETLLKYIKKAESPDYEYTQRLNEFCDEFAKYCHGESSADVLDIVLDKEDLV